MGYEINRFLEEVDEELLCTICGQVLEAPVQIPSVRALLLQLVHQ